MKGEKTKFNEKMEKKNLNKNCSCDVANKTSFQKELFKES